MTEINKDDIQAVVDARLQSIKDSYMDEGAMLKLRNDLLHETRAEQVQADVKPGTRLLQADVFVTGIQFHSEVELSQDVPHVVVDPIAPGINVHRDDLAVRQAEGEADQGDESRDADVGGNAKHLR